MLAQTSLGLGQWPILALVVAAVLVAFTASGSLSIGEDSTSQSTGKATSLEALKQRYVAGEIDDVEFERKLETLFENETVSDVERSLQRETDSTGDPESSPETVEPEPRVEDTHPERRKSRHDRRCGSRRRSCR
ncbi:SHOCT domain-containing protein [Halodesulfurarchaeum sp. HSR-GB]|uniref:SHOCT domain-containing protein n=1 Tax=Halodesulfurarchaeum sp. HSR-GB TaxID=3074077 RepID=UPI00285A1682|nr:SHOCT domain-containing protein [Halodesulfurarchaeum sp. HSR-GB]MDR5655636.1 SHOCT domain-containing protein [Halodesulfurarchaeum sp. HSR-GB]